MSILIHSNSMCRLLKAIKRLVNNNYNVGKFDSLEIELRFKIGEQYELNEFNLKSIDSIFENGIEYETYEYIKDDFKALFGVKFSNNVILQYNADILYRVIYEFNKNQYDYLYSKISKFTKEEVFVDLVKDENCCQIVQENGKKAHF